jgi:hypothetical protein
MGLTADHLDPPIGGGSGYFVRDRDLRFLDISEAEVAFWRTQSVPLGLSKLQYDGFRDDLLDAFRLDGLAIQDCDVRLKGSAAAFFSGHHKRLPWLPGEILDAFRDCRGRIPKGWELAEIDHRLHRLWITDGVFPARRPFDSMARLGISREPSDIDLQVSSDEIVQRCVAELQALGQDATEVRIKHPTYNFVRKDLVEYAAPNLYLFALRTSDALNRHMSIAIFPSEGPPDVSDQIGELSSHFRDIDWLIAGPVDEGGAG